MFSTSIENCFYLRP